MQLPLPGIEGGRAMRSRYQTLPSMVFVPFVLTSSPYATPVEPMPAAKSQRLLENTRARISLIG